MHHSIELIDIHVRLGSKEVLKGVDVEAKPYEFISIIGANGAGKTTLIRMILDILKPDSGEIHFSLSDSDNDKSGKWNAQAHKRSNPCFRGGP